MDTQEKEWTHSVSVQTLEEPEINWQPRARKPYVFQVICTSTEYYKRKKLSDRKRYITHQTTVVACSPANALIKTVEYLKTKGIVKLKGVRIKGAITPLKDWGSITKLR